jgi:hypothetical protein
MKAPDFATGQDRATNGVCVAQSTFEAVPEVDGAQIRLRRFV